MLSCLRLNEPLRQMGKHVVRPQPRNKKKCLYLNPAYSEPTTRSAHVCTCPCISAGTHYQLPTRLHLQLSVPTDCNLPVAPNNPQQSTLAIPLPVPNSPPTHLQAYTHTCTRPIYRVPRNPPLPRSTLSTHVSYPRHETQLRRSITSCAW